MTVADQTEPFVVTVKEIIIDVINGVPKEHWLLDKFSIFGLEPSIQDDHPKI